MTKSICELSFESPRMFLQIDLEESSILKNYNNFGNNNNNVDYCYASVDVDKVYVKKLATKRVANFCVLSHCWFMEYCVANDVHSWRKLV